MIDRNLNALPPGTILDGYRRGDREYFRGHAICANITEPAAVNELRQTTAAGHPFKPVRATPSMTYPNSMRTIASHRCTDLRSGSAPTVIAMPIAPSR